MADGFTIDTSEIDRLAADLGDAPKAIAADVVKALAVNAGKVKASWREKVAGSDTAPRAPYSIDYEQLSTLTAFQSSVEFEIGARKGTGKQGGVVLLWEYGAPSRNLPARGLGLASLEENLEDLQTGVEKAISSGMGRVGL